MKTLSEVKNKVLVSVVVAACVLADVGTSASYAGDANVEMRWRIFEGDVLTLGCKSEGAVISRSDAVHRLVHLGTLPSLTVKCTIKQNNNEHDAALMNARSACDSMKRDGWFIDSPDLDDYDGQCFGRMQEYYLTRKFTMNLELGASVTNQDPSKVVGTVSDGMGAVQAPVLYEIPRSGGTLPLPPRLRGDAVVFNRAYDEPYTFEVTASPVFESAHDNPQEAERIAKSMTGKTLRYYLWVWEHPA